MQLPAHATIGEAARVIDREAVGAVVVVDSAIGLPIGVVTDRDLVVRAVARELPTDASVDAVRSMGVICVDAHADIHETVHLFATHTVRRLPVVSGAELVGMLTVDDLLVDLSGDLANLVRGVTAQVLFGHAEQEPVAAPPDFQPDSAECRLNGRPPIVPRPAVSHAGKPRTHREITCMHV